MGNGIPSVSFNLRHGGSVLIERNNPKDALNKIKKFGELLKKKKYSAVIFPEGTRSRDGNPKKFQNSKKLSKTGFFAKKSRKRAFVEFRRVSRLIFEFRAPICFWVLFSARSVEVVHIII